MGKEFESVMEGLSELLDYAGGDRTKARRRIVERPEPSVRAESRGSPPNITVAPLHVYTKEEIRRIRLNNNLTLKTFASCMGVSQKTVESWEKGTNVPSGASLRLLQIFENKPNALRELEIISTEG
jgi:putative transcriptional regulator